MDQPSILPDTDPPPIRGRAPLVLVRPRLCLGDPQERAPDDWESGLAQLLGWLGMAAERHDSTAAPGPQAPVFAPWRGCSPAALQHGGSPALPQARFIASYGLDHPRSAPLGRAPLDVVLLSPHPSTCRPATPGGVPCLPAGILHAMLGAARSEGRGRIAVIVHARQRLALAAPDCEVLALEDALPRLVSGRAPWDAIIAMPDLRSTVFTLLAGTGGVRGAWPMLWFGADETGGRELRLVTAETAGEQGAEGQHLPLDATVLVLALALSLREAGAARAAWRLHEGWARLRDSGVAASSLGAGDAPYVNAVADSAFLALLCGGKVTSQRPQRGWLALKNAEPANSGTRTGPLRVIA